MTIRILKIKLKPCFFVQNVMMCVFIWKFDVTRKMYSVQEEMWLNHTMSKIVMKFLLHHFVYYLFKYTGYKLSWNKNYWKL